MPSWSGRALVPRICARLRSEIENGTLLPTLTEQFRHQVGYSPARGEVRSWERSLQVLSADLVESGLGQVEALVEYQLPMTSKRADVVLCGTHPRTGAPSYVVVELKQWSRALMLDGSDDVCILEGMGGDCILRSRYAATAPT